MEFLLNQLLHLLQFIKIEQVTILGFQFPILSLFPQQFLQLFHLLKVFQIKNILETGSLGFAHMFCILRMAASLVFLVFFVMFTFLPSVFILFPFLHLCSVFVVALLMFVFMLVLRFVLMLLLFRPV